MNHIYHSIWSEVLGSWIAVAENTKSKGKRISKSSKLLATGLLLCSSGSWALPTGEQVVSGQVSVTSPSSTQMQISQGTQNAIINWNGFSIAPNEGINILQPNASAMLLNRVVGIDASIIQGQLTANGQVFLINPNGILFSNSAQVDVGGLIASTHNISNADFLNGNYHFTQDGANGTVSNQGYIRTPAGGVVALIGTQISSSGTIATPQGTTALAAGKTVDLDFKGNGLVEVNIPEAALNAQVNNNGAILADGGRVVLTAKAAGDLVSTVLGTEGLIQARSLTSRNGEIILDGGSNGVVQVNGTLDVSGQQNGGSINVTGQNINLASSSNLVAQALNSGTAGTINVLGDMTSGTVNVAGKLDASASGTANGGFIETSAAHVKIADTAKVSTLAANGNSGTWLIDPNDFIIANSGGDITGAALSSMLSFGNVDIHSSMGSNSIGPPITNLYAANAGNGDIFVNDAIYWSSGTTLSLIAEHNIYINADIIASGELGAYPSLMLSYGMGYYPYGYSNANSNYFIDPTATIILPEGQNFSTTTFDSVGQPVSTQYYNFQHIGNETTDDIAGIVNPENYQPFFYSDDDAGQSFSSPVADNSQEFTGANVSSSKFALFDSLSGQQNNRQIFAPTFTIKNSAGQIRDLQLSANRQFLSLLLEDGSIRIWDFQLGVQRQINVEDLNQALSKIGRVDDSGALQTIVSNSGIDVYDVLSSSPDKNIRESGIKHFSSSPDGNLLLTSTGADILALWDSKQNRKLWQTTYQRGVVKNLVMADNKRYAAVLGSQHGSYIVSDKLRHLTDAVDLIELDTGKISKSLPNLGEDIIYMRFKNNNSLQLGLANGEIVDWDILSNSTKTVSSIAKSVIAVDTAGDQYAYLLDDGTVHVRNSQGKIQLNIQNQSNPFKQVLLLKEGKKLITAMASGDLSLWDVAAGKKMLNLFSTQQGGWTVMDAFGRFDGSEKALENFSWLANEEEIPLSSFSENYYEPGLLANVLQNQDYLNSNPNVVREGISLPPKIDLQLVSQQTGTDNVAMQLDVFDRGGGINKINAYHNGRILSDNNIVKTNQHLEEQGTGHQVFKVNITPTSGRNTLSVSASNEMGIESNPFELSFDGKTKAYTSSLRLLTVGINQYSDERMNLKYSVPDANLIQQVLKNNAKLTFNKALFNENATKPKILAQLKELSLASQQDTIVVYLAGHGLAVGKEWYFLPYETKLTTEEDIATKAVSASELSVIFKNSKVQHILLMVDACYSGAGMKAFSQLQNSQRHFSRQLSHSLGITVVTAASKNQEAFEMKSLGHGLFTYLMSQELQKKDSAEPVTAHSVAKKITKTLPSFSRKTVGVTQEPVAYTHGSDFILTNSLKEAEKTPASDSAASDLLKKSAQ